MVFLGVIPFHSFPAEHVPGCWKLKRNQIGMVVIPFSFVAFPRLSRTDCVFFLLLFFVWGGGGDGNSKPACQQPTNRSLAVGIRRWNGNPGAQRVFSVPHEDGFWGVKKGILGTSVPRDPLKRLAKRVLRFSKLRRPPARNGPAFAGELGPWEVAGPGAGRAQEGLAQVCASATNGTGR